MKFSMKLKQGAFQLKTEQKEPKAQKLSKIKLSDENSTSLRDLVLVKPNK